MIIQDWQYQAFLIYEKNAGSNLGVMKKIFKAYLKIQYWKIIKTLTCKYASICGATC
ncbi:MAG: hypothetical protein QM784_08495 [Polyangiaceae bacterium]